MNREQGKKQDTVNKEQEGLKKIQTLQTLVTEISDEQVGKAADQVELQRELVKISLRELCRM